MIQTSVRDRCLTVLYPELKKDPVKMMEKIRRFLSPESTSNPDIERKVSNHFATKKHRSKHPYDPATGINKIQIRERLKGKITSEWLE